MLTPLLTLLAWFALGYLAFGLVLGVMIVGEAIHREHMSPLDIAGLLVVCMAGWGLMLASYAVGSVRK